MNKIRKGDEVIVITGRDKGRRGRVLSRKDANYLLVDGINMVKKHVKPNPMKGEEGGIMDKNMPIHQSNVAIYNAATGKADKVQIKQVEKTVAGKAKQVNVRVYKSSGEEIKVA